MKHPEEIEMEAAGARLAAAMDAAHAKYPGYSNRAQTAALDKYEAEIKAIRRKYKTTSRDNPEICTPCGVKDVDWAENPLPSSAWPWLIGGAVVAGAAWLYLSKKKSVWNCRAGMRCTHFVKDNSWHAKNLLDNSLAIYSTPPENFKDLTLEETAPDGSYHVYDSIKPAVMTDGLPELTP